jgi:nitrous oxidase accessory protein
MKQKLPIFFLGLALLLFISPNVHAKSPSLQALINRAHSGETIHLENKKYSGPIVITKPITLVGSRRTIIEYSGNRPAISIKNSKVKLKNLKVYQKSRKKAAITITGHNHKLEAIQVYTKAIGVKMDNVIHSKFEGIEIKGSGSENGIIVSESTYNSILKSKISNVLDAIYIENSDHNIFLHNKVKESRYGFHLMFSKDLLIKDNESTKNYIGAMIMETERTIIEWNTFADNAQNVNAYGLLLYDTTNTRVRNNTFLRNRIGIKIEKSKNNDVLNNTAMTNFVGIQFDAANSNHVRNNTFLGNVNDIQAIKSKDNTLIKNFWDSSMKLDINNSGTSIIPNKSDPFFFTLTKDVPEYQLFFQSPGMILLQKMLKSPDNLVLSDDAPLMSMNSTPLKKEPSSVIGLWIVSVSMILVCSTLIKLWRKVE